MQKAANWVRGWVEAEAESASPEEFFNRLAREDLPFWQAKQLSACRWRFRTSFYHWERVRKAAHGSGCQLKLLRRGGLPGLAWRLRFRCGFWAGMAASLAAVMVLSQFVLTVRVSGNRKVSTGAILTELYAHGVRPGAFGPGLDVRQIGHEVILAIPELSWMSVNLHGTVAEVLVREGETPPELVEEDVPARIIAKCDGIVTKAEVTRGQQLVDRGSTVKAGDVLVDSWVDFVEPEGYQGDMGGILVRAMGRVEARVWHTLRASIPLETAQKAYTGRESARWSIELLGKSRNIFGKGGIPYEKYDKITVYHHARLPGGHLLPLGLRKETLREYSAVPGPIDEAEAVTMLKARLYSRLLVLADGGRILRTDYAVDSRDGLLTVTAVGETLQQIGMTVEDR